MKSIKWLICLFAVLFSCTPFMEENSSEEAIDNNQGIQIQNQALSPAENISCSLYQNGIGIECYLGKLYFRLVFYEYHEITHASCFKGFIPHSHIDVKTLKQPIMKLDENVDISLFNIHFGLHKNSKGKWCFLLWITTSGKFTKTATGEIWCTYHCFKKLKNAKKDIKKEWKKFSKKMGIQGIAGGTIGWLIWKGYKCLAIKKCDFAPGWGPSPADEGFDDDFDEPDEPVRPNGCECNLPENDGNICPDDTLFGKPNPAEYKSELTVVGRDENFLYIFGKDASLFNRAIFWSDPNTEGLENCESYGQWNGTFMVHKLQSCRTWFRTWFT